VDDEDAVRFALKRILVRCGCSVVEARDGMEALERIDTAPPIDVIITDHKMPRLNGTGLLESVIAKGSAAKLVLCTGVLNDITFGPLASEAQIQVLSKPFTATDVRTLVMSFGASGSKGTPDGSAAHA